MLGRHGLLMLQRAEEPSSPLDLAVTFHPPTLAYFAIQPNHTQPKGGVSRGNLNVIGGAMALRSLFLLRCLRIRKS